MAFRSIRRLLRPRARTFATCAALVASMLWTLPAGAQDRWSTPFPGVRRLDRTASGPRRIHALVIDLCQAGISFRATRESERRQTVPAFAGSVGAEAAINADFFSYETYHASGAAMGDGVAWGNPDSRGSGFLAFGSERVLYSTPGDVVDPLPGWMRQVVGGHPAILRDGAVLDHPGSDLCNVRHPRTAAGLSEDRQTLYLVVVDGRSSASIGMTCAEEATLLRGLGADDAINLDGGGSSTMWIRGAGVVNAPSDGSPRVVANHLAIQAAGSGLPGSCMPWEPDETEMLAAVIEDGGASDLDGDGRADVCARASDGVRCHLSTGDAFGEAIAGPGWSDDTGWGDPEHWETILLGDVTGDGLADVCGRAGAGMRCVPSTGDGFGATIPGPPLSDDDGWDVPARYATIRLADVDGDGRDDLCARAAAGFTCWRAIDGGFAAADEPLAALSDAAGAGAIDRWGTIRTADVDGDGMVDVCARGAEGLDCWRSTGAGFDPEPIVGPRWSDASGWRAHRYFSTIRVTDVDGDGRADACARSASDFRCHLSSGDALGAAIVLDALADDGGWDDYANYSTIRLADVDGDGDRDLCARAGSGIVCWPWEGAAFGARFTGPELADTNGWGHAAHYRTIRFGDVDGDGDEDLCARGGSRFDCWISDGGAFANRIDGPAWSNASGWAEERFHATIRFAGPRRARVEPAPDGGVIGADDAAVPAPDAGFAPRDAGTRNDAGSRPSAAIGSSCACRAGQGARAPSAVVALALLALAIARRRIDQRGCRDSR